MVYKMCGHKCARRNRQVYSKNYTCLLANKTGCDKSKVQTALLNYDNHKCNIK